MAHTLIQQLQSKG